MPLRPTIRVVLETNQPSSRQTRSWGIGTGWFFGYLMPKWLHYGSSGSRPVSLISRLSPASGRDGIVWSPTFNAVGDGGIIGVRGTL